MKKNIVKLIIGMGTVLGLRVMPHPPNVEPIMSSMMPFAKRFGMLIGFVFSVLAILLYDFITGTFGFWSYITAATYGLLGIAAAMYLKNKDSKLRYYVGFSIVGTLIFDAITGVGMGMYFFKQPFMMVLMQQIPFTLYHLAGSIVLTLTLTPLMLRFVVDNKHLETDKVVEKVGQALKA